MRRPPHRPANSLRVGGVPVHLTRIYTRTGDGGTTAAATSEGPQDRPAGNRLPDCDEANAQMGVAVRRRRARGGTEVLDGSTTSSTWARTSAPVVPVLPSTRRYASPRTTWIGWRAVRPVQRRPATLDSFLLPGGTPAGACCTWRDGGPAGRAHHVGAAAQRPERTNPLAAIPEPALGPAVHPGPGGQPRRRRAVAPWRRRP